MQRYFIEQSKQEVTAAPAFSIKGEDVHHIATVMRMSPGDEVICCAKDGHEAKCRIESVTKEEVLLSVIEWTGKHANCPSRSILQTAFQKEISWNGSFKKGQSSVQARLFLFRHRAPLLNLMKKGKEKTGKVGENRQGSGRTVPQKRDSRCGAGSHVSTFA